VTDGRAQGWDEAFAWVERLAAPGLGKPVSAVQPDLHPIEDLVVATSEVRSSLEEPATAQVVLFSDDGPELVREGSRPVWSPDGTRLAHLDEHGVWVVDQHVALTGRCERLAWSPDGRRLLVVLAEPGSEVPNADGSGLVGYPEERDAWIPTVSDGVAPVAWRRLVVLDAATLEHAQVGRTDLNVWDACWAGTGAVLAVCSDGSSAESAWYQADLRLISLDGSDRVLHAPTDQIGAVAASPSGEVVAWVRAVCSDRDLSAGELHLVDTRTGSARQLAVGADVTDVRFVDEGLLGFAGLRGLTTVVGTVTPAGDVSVLWESESESISGIQPQASFRPGRTAFVRNGFFCAPEVLVLHGREVHQATSLAHAGTALIRDTPWRTEVRRWTAPVGLEIEGWLHLPAGEGPHPLVVMVHGGPVHAHRSTWPGPGSVLPRLVAEGYAILMPNPRGSSGRGLDFQRAVVGDLGGADAADITSGVEALVAEGLVDRDRIGVTGGSYGGFMSAWLVTQSDLFAAAVPMHPVTDWVYQHGTSNIPYWDELFLDGKPYAEDGQYRQRSPLTHVGQVRTPTLFIAGHLDRATPAGQALVMHQALLDHGVPSACVVFPHAAHGARDLPSVVDNLARITHWFAQWMPARRTSS
jgi:dipeptidyl aminopeptidase/acylaminoacyl peptidase